VKTDTKELAATVRQMASAFFTEEVLPLRKLCNEAADRMEELERDLASKDAHADEIYKAAVDLAKKLEDDLAAERKLTDRLAHWLSEMADEFILPAELENAANNALAAWKEARNDT
jgi:uncharacterized protein YoxC